MKICFFFRKKENPSVSSVSIFKKNCSILQALYNVSSTSTRSSDEVLEELKRVLELADIMFKQKGCVSHK